jgi:hypothetical protein
MTPRDVYRSVHLNLGHRMMHATADVQPYQSLVSNNDSPALRAFVDLRPRSMLQVRHAHIEP